MRSSVNGKRSPQPRRLVPVAAMGIGLMAAVAATYGARLLAAQPRVAGSTGPEPSAMASIADERSTTIIVSTPNSNDCRRYQLNVATGERGVKGSFDCNAESGNRPGRLQAISKAFRNR
jgi:hypothetical protein